MGKTKAKNKKEFEQAWNEHIGQLYALAHSLPSQDALAFLNDAKSLLRYVEIASEYIFKNPLGEVGRVEIQAK